MRPRYIPFVYVLFLAIAVKVAAQGIACAPIVQRALDTTAAICTEMERNQVCYGNSRIDPTLTDETIIFEVGVTTDLENVENMVLYPFNDDPEEWGIAVLAVQASIDDDAPENVTMVLFGDAEFDTIGEAYYFQSGDVNEDCAAAPNGMLIQTPEGVAEINLLINEVDIRLGSTAYVKAEADGLMSIALLEGEATVTAADTEVTIEAGMLSTIPLDEDLHATRAPSAPEPIDEGVAETLPLVLLPRDITAASEDGASNAEIIQPLSGEWTLTPDELEVTGSCDPSTVETYRSIFSDTSSRRFDFPVPFDFRAHIQSVSSGSLPPEVVFENPEPNLYSYTTSVSDFSVTYEFHILSPTTIETRLTYDYSPSGSSCVITSPATLERTGD
jgi:hypothetical protein